MREHNSIIVSKLNHSKKKVKQKISFFLEIPYHYIKVPQESRLSRVIEVPLAKKKSIVL
jgi:hypothetical protein